MMADYMTCTALTDAGPFVTRLILTMPEEVAAGAAGPPAFSTVTWKAFPSMVTVKFPVQSFPPITRWGG